MHVAVKKRFVAASVGVRSSWRFGNPGFLLVCYRPLGPFVRQALEGDNDILYLCPQTRTTRLGLAGFGAKLRSHHKLAVRVQNEGSAACKEVACIIIACRSKPKRYVHQNWGCPHASRRDAHHS